MVLFELLTVVLDYFNPMNGLAGILKVPKGGKVKKGWETVYLAFSDNQLFLYKSQEDYDSGKQGTVICEIDSEIFVARSVSQNELIHANARDIDMIFKVQAYTPKHDNSGKSEVCFRF